MSRVRAPFVPALALAIVVSALALLLPASAAPPPSGEDACRSGVVSLTFDDGPARPTGRLVRILRAAHVPATFFMVGQRVAASPSRRAGGAGRLPDRQPQLGARGHDDADLRSGHRDSAGHRRARCGARERHPTRLMRPPYGALDDAARDGIRAAGFVPVLWTIDSRDWESGTAGRSRRASWPTSVRTAPTSCSSTTASDGRRSRWTQSRS